MLLHQVLHDEPRPPRKLNDHIPRDLQTICLKAMAKDPARRFPSAGELRDDLRRWLDGKPIKSRPVGSFERAWRWANRHRAVASLLTTLAIVVVLAFAGMALLWAARSETRKMPETNSRKPSYWPGMKLELGPRARNRPRSRSGAAEELRRRDYISRVNLAHRELLEDNVPRVFELLDGCPRDLRGWEWEYVRRQSQLDFRTFRETGPMVNAVALSADGRLVALGSGTFHPGGQGDLTVREIASGRVAFSRLALTGGVRAVAFSPDAKTVTAGYGVDLVSWQLDSGKEVFTRTDHGRLPLLGLAYSPDGRTIVAGYGGFIGNARSTGHAHIIDAKTGSLLGNPLAGRVGGVWSVAFSPDGTQVALTGDGLVDVWDVASRRPVRTLRGHSGYVYGVAFSSDGQYIASCGLDRSIRLWERSTGRELRVLRGHQGFVRGVAFSPDSRRLVSVAEDDTVRLWQVSSDADPVTLHGHQHFTTCVAFSPDGFLIASGSMDSTAKIWLAGCTGQTSFHGKSWVQNLAFSPNGQRLAASFRDYPKNPGMVLVDPDSKEVLWYLANEGAKDIAFSPDGHLLVAAERHAVTIRDAQTGRVRSTLGGPPATVGGLAFLSGGRELLTACEDGIGRVWDADAGTEFVQKRFQIAKPFRQGPSEMTLLRSAFSADRRQFGVISTNMTVTINGVLDKREARSIRGIGPNTRAVAFQPHGRQIAIVGGRSATLPGSITAGVGGEVLVFNVETSEPIAKLQGHTDVVACAAYSPDGRRLATAGDDRIIKLWDTDKFEEVFSLRGHTAGVLTLAFSSDGRRLASGGIDLSFRVWDLDPPSPASLEAPQGRG